MFLKQIRHGSEAYRDMISLRLQVLLEPLGIPASYIDREREKSDLLIGAFEKEHMIGCCILTPRENGLVQLRQMAVASDHQGRGIGSAILLFAENLARQHQYTVLMMHARNPVMDFYKKSGYETAGGEFFEVGLGHHKMQKSLVSGDKS
ncbi:MAG: GNAT family N-acetyltransferase [Flavisolibacter sp.]